MNDLLRLGGLLVLVMVTAKNTALANDNIATIFSPAFSEISGYVSGEVSFFPKVGLPVMKALVPSIGSIIH